MYSQLNRNRQAKLTENPKFMSSFGVPNAGQTDYSDYSKRDGKGYVLKTAQEVNSMGQRINNYFPSGVR